MQLSCLLPWLFIRETMMLHFSFKKGVIHRKSHQCEAEGTKLARKAGGKGKKKNIARGKELPEANQALPHLGKAENNPGKPNPAGTQKHRCYFYSWRHWEISVLHCRNMIIYFQISVTEITLKSFFPRSPPHFLSNSYFLNWTINK